MNLMFRNKNNPRNLLITQELIKETKMEIFLNF